MLKPNPVKEMKKLQLEVTASQMDRLDAIKDQCGFSTRKELFNNAMTLFSWAVREAEKGNKIASYDEESDHVERILLPALEEVFSNASSNQEHQEVGGRQPAAKRRNLDLVHQSATPSPST